MKSLSNKSIIDLNTLPWPAAIYRWEDNGFIILDFNKTAAKLEGVNREEIIGKPLCKVFPGIADLGLLEKLLDAHNLKSGQYLETSYYQDQRIQGWRENYILPISEDDLLVTYSDTSEIAKNRQESQAFGQIIDLTFNEVYIFNVKDYKFSFANQAALDNLGYSLEEIQKMAPYNIKPHFDQSQFAKCISPVITKQSGHLTFETTHQRKDGSYYDVEIRAQVMGLSGQEQVVVIANDITERRKEEKKRELLSQAVAQTDDMIIITDCNGLVCYVNDSFCRRTGYNRQELIGKKNNLLKSGEHDSEFYQCLWQTLLSGEVFKSTFINRKKNGSIFFVDQVITPIFDEHEKLTHFVATGKDSTEQVHLHRKLTEMATYDSLTGIFNRHKTTELLEKELNRYQHNLEATFALVMFDIDHFKTVNDTFGHAAGDAVLKELCNTVGQCIRKSDIFGRFGGEEFIIIAPNILSKDYLYTFTEKILQAVERQNFSISSQVTISVGITLVEPDDTFSGLLKRVDDALYMAKNGGRNQGVCLTKNSLEHVKSTEISVNY